jgi:hypothetical protein
VRALDAILNPVRPAGDATTPAAPTAPASDPTRELLSTLNADIRVWRFVSLALGVTSVWLGFRAARESSRYRRALADAAKSREARKAALKTLGE